MFIAIIATTLAMMLLHVDSAAVLKSNGDGLESSLAGHLQKGSDMTLEGAQYVNVRGVYTGGANFFQLINERKWLF